MKWMTSSSWVSIFRMQSLRSPVEVPLPPSARKSGSARKQRSAVRYETLHQDESSLEHCSKKEQPGRCGTGTVIISDLLRQYQFRLGVEPLRKCTGVENSSVLPGRT